MPAGRSHKEEKKDTSYEGQIAKTVNEVKPEDLGKVGVQKTGLAMGAAEAIKQNKLAMEKALKETE